MTQWVDLNEASKHLGKPPSSLRRLCTNGTTDFIYRQAVYGKDRHRWEIDLDSIHSSSSSEYERLHTLWIKRMESGLGYKKPVSPRGVESAKYGLFKFWLFIEDPPTIKRGYRKGDPVLAPKRKPNLPDITKQNLELALSQVPIDRDNQNCHYSLREKMYNGFRSFFKFLVAEGLRSRTDFNDLDDCKPSRIYEERRPLLSEESLRNLILKNDSVLQGRASNKQTYDIRLTKMIIYLATFCSLRREEIVDLQISHIDFNLKELSVIDGKGNKNRPVGFSKEVRDLMLDWIKNHRPASKKDNLLVRLNGEPLTDDIVYRRIRRMGKSTNLDINPHGLRRTGASLALESGIDIELISKHLGHTRTSTTEKSYVKVSKKRTVDAFKGFFLTDSPKKISTDKLTTKRKQKKIKFY